MSEYGFRDLGEYELSIEKILAKKPDSTLWRHYLGRDFELGRSIPAPYRTDKTPSFNLKYDPRSGKIVGKDYGRGGFHGDVFDYVQRVFNLDFYSALVKVNTDFNLGLEYNPNYKAPAVDRVSKKEIEVLSKFQTSYEQKDVFLEFLKRHPFNKEDIAYWTQYGISGLTLLTYRVYAAERVWRDKRPVYNYHKPDPCYVYYFPQTEYRPKPRLKCYWPMRQTIRFMGNCSNNHDVQGYDQCSIAKKERGKVIVLTKSLKDCMVLHEFGIEAMATHGESQKFSADFIRHLRKYYDTIVSLYDRDVTGIRGARYLWRDYGIRPYFINKKYRCKDVSDLFKVHGRQVTNSFLQQIKERNADKENYGDIHPEERPESIQQQRGNMGSITSLR